MLSLDIIQPLSAHNASGGATVVGISGRGGFARGRGRHAVDLLAREWIVSRMPGTQKRRVWRLAEKKNLPVMPG